MQTGQVSHTHTHTIKAPMEPTKEILQEFNVDDNDHDDVAAEIRQISVAVCQLHGYYTGAIQLVFKRRPNNCLDTIPMNWKHNLFAQC